MTPTIKLLDKFFISCSAKNDSDVARALRRSPQAVNGWRKGTAHPDAESVERMCTATGESLAHWLPLIESERARNPEAKRVWLRLAQAAAVVVLAFGLDVHTAKAGPSQDGLNFAKNPASVYYVQLAMRRIRAILKAVTAALSAHRQGVSYAEKALAA